MTGNVTVENVDHNGQRLLWFRNLSTPYKVLITNMEEADVAPKGFRDIASNMPNFTRLQLDRLNEMHSHYLDSMDIHDDIEKNDKRIHGLVKEIASTDPSIVRRVELTTQEVLNDLVKYCKIKKIVRGTNEDGEKAIGLVYQTHRKPESRFNQYNEDTQERITWTSEGYRETYLEQLGSFLSGEFNVPFMDYIPE